MKALFLVTAMLLLAGAETSVAGEKPPALPLDPPTPGMWYDPTHNGHGFDLQKQGDTWFFVFYSYGSDGLPEWYLAVGSIVGDTFQADLSRFAYDPDSSPPQSVDAIVGATILRFDAADDDMCSSSKGTGERAVFEWIIDGESGAWCVQPLIAAAGDPDIDFTGHWFAGAADQGWGLTVYFQGEAQAKGESPAADKGAALEFLVLYYYDANGFPRWALGLADDAGSEAHAGMDTFFGYCRTCEPVPLTTQTAGSIDHVFEVTGDKLVGGVADIDVVFDPAPGGQWLREQILIELLSDPAPRLLPIPDILDSTETIAFVDITVVPMNEEILLEHQTVIVEGGVITSVEHVNAKGIPADAMVIDGRRRYLAPGVADMHTHLSAGGFFAAQTSGVMSIAAGVTTSLNMGDGTSFSLPDMRDQWINGELIGPTLYLGKTAYGPNDNALRDYDAQTPATVDTVQRARQYAQSIRNQGYDFIKIYNTLSVPVVNELFNQGQLLGLPVIGHAPKLMTIQVALAGGQRMIAHIAEVYFTFFRNSMQPLLLAPSADLVRDAGVWQTATISTSEVFAGLYGGNVEAFNEFTTRPGSEYIHAGLRSFWVGAFNSGFYNPTGAQIGSLDARLAFFKDMVKAMHDGGVKLIGGTDAPGHPGLVPGYAMYEELRIFVEAGIPTFDAIAAVTRNPGQFIDETLAPDVGFGTVETGRRADLLLLDSNPLEDYTNLMDRVGVMARGRWWSQEYLEGVLKSRDGQKQTVQPTEEWLLELTGRH